MQLKICINRHSTALNMTIVYTIFSNDGQDGNLPMKHTFMKN